MLQNKIIKCTILLFTFILVSCGGGGSNNESYAKETTTEDISENVISGTAAKGIIKNGIVKIYGVLNGSKQHNPLATGNTDDNGDYSLIINNYIGPLFIEITADPNSTKMICDLTPSCGEVDFGDEINLTDDFNLKAVVSDCEKDKPVTANVTPITSLVAAYAESHSSIDSTLITNANSQVANLFNLTGKLSEKPVIDITDSANLKDKSKDELNLAILNSAIVSAAMDGNENISSGLDKLVTKFAERDGQFLNNGGYDEVSVADVFNKASDILNMNIFSEMEIVDSLKESVALKEAHALSLSSDSTSNSMPSEIPESILVESAKAIVENIRDFSLQVTYENSEEVSVAEDLENALDFVDSDELSTLNDTFELATLALEEAYLSTMENLYNEIFVSSYTYEYDDLVIPVSISRLNDNYLYSINETVNSIAINLEAKSNGKRILGSETYSGYPCYYDLAPNDLLILENAAASFDVNGSLDSEFLKINILNGTASVRHDCSFKAEDGFNAEYYDDHMTFSIDLNLNITETTPDPLVFSGNLKYNTEVSLSSVYRENDNDSYGSNDIKSFAVDLNTTFSGEFEKNHKKTAVTITASGSEQQGDFWNNGINLSTPDTAVTQETYSNSNEINFYDILSAAADYFYIAQEDIESDLIDVDIDEADKSQATIGVSLQFTTSKTSNITGINLVSNASDYGSREWDIDIALGQRYLYFDYKSSIDDPELTVINQNGTILKINETCFEMDDECSNVGNIIVDGKEMATISYDVGNEAYIINYNDGTYELF